jgi:hypothetical protein
MIDILDLILNTEYENYINFLEKEEFLSIKLSNQNEVFLLIMFYKKLQKNISNVLDSRLLSKISIFISNSFKLVEKNFVNLNTKKIINEEKIILDEKNYQNEIIEEKLYSYFWEIQNQIKENNFEKFEKSFKLIANIFDNKSFNLVKTGFYIFNNR